MGSSLATCHRAILGKVSLRRVIAYGCTCFAMACSSTASKQTAPKQDASADAASDSSGTPDAAPEAGMDASLDSADSAPPISYMAEVLKDSPIVYLRFEDDGSAGLDLETLGSVGAKCALQGPAGTFGQSGIGGGKALKLDGSSDIRCGSAAGFPDKAPFTLEGWFRLDDNATLPQRLIHRIAKPTGATEGYFLETNTTSVVVRRYRDGGANSAKALVGSGLVLGAWTYLAATYDGKDLCMRSDDQPAECKPSGQNLLLLAANLVISGPGANFRGALDEVAIYSKALSKERLDAHYAAGKAK